MDVICEAVKCYYNEMGECTRNYIVLKPSADDAEPPYCAWYSDPWYDESEGE